jgi:hypothetical protein
MPLLRNGSNKINGEAINLRGERVKRSESHSLIRAGTTYRIAFENSN